MTRNLTHADLTLVMPAKNAQSTISRTFESLTSHLEKGGHCILLDDGSTDQTTALMQVFAEQWKNIRYMRRDVALGAGSARNLGIDSIDTALYGSIDADDWVHPDYFTTQIELMNKYQDVDFVRTNFFKCFGNKRQLVTASFDVYNTPFDPRLGILPVNKPTLVDFPQMWAGIYSMDFFNKNDIRYDDLFTAEDRILNWKTQVLGQKMIVSSENRFFYRQGNSQSLTQVGDMRQLDFLTALENVVTFLIANDSEHFLPKAIRQTLALICFHLDARDRLDPAVRTALVERSKWLLNMLPERALETALSRIDKKRRETIRGLI